MVFFTCNNCGESVKKPAVEKHYNTRCRGAPKNVSCMDCQKDFRGEEYVAHIKCITEAEKYSGKDYVPKEAKNSGAKKQESWMDIIRSILESSDYKLSAQSRSAFQRLQSVDNVPRKKAKFQNFVSNCMRMPRNQAEEVWIVLEKELEKMKQERQKEVAEAKEAQEAAKKEKLASQQNGTKRVATEEGGHAEPVASKKSKKSKSDENAEQNGHDEPAKKKSKKQKLAEIIADAEPSAAETTIDGVDEEEFQWTASLEKIVGKHASGIPLDKLKKKLLKKYVAKLGGEELSEKQQKKFEKKFSKNVKKCAALQVEGEVAKPC